MRPFRPARVLMGRCVAAWFLAALAALAGFWPGSVSGGAAAKPPTVPPLTSVSRSPRLPGKFVWADLVTDNIPAARKFYGELFGWTFRDVGGYVPQMPMPGVRAR